jgi:serine/threonine protein phosphatase PrpC
VVAELREFVVKDHEAGLVDIACMTSLCASRSWLIKRFDAARCMAGAPDLTDARHVAEYMSHDFSILLEPSVSIMPVQVGETKADLALSFASGAVTHVGGVRASNEDAYVAADLLCAVADGMGGHQAGEVASSAVTAALEQSIENGPFGVAELAPLISKVNNQIRTTAASSGREGMGTTVVGVVIAQNGSTQSAVVFNVGDSRCYRLTAESFEQVTVDHSHVQELVDAGHVSASEAKRHPMRNIVTRALGPDAEVGVDLFVLDDEDCRLLLCSDGLSGQVEIETIESILRETSDQQVAALALVEHVLTGPAPDNVTAVVIDVSFRHLGGDDETLPSGFVNEATLDITADRSLTAAQILEASQLIERESTNG